MLNKAPSFGLFVLLTLAVTANFTLRSPGAEANSSFISITASPNTPHEDIVMAGDTGVLMSAFELKGVAGNFVMDRFTVVSNFENTPGDLDRNFDKITLEYTDSEGVLRESSSFLVDGEAYFAGLDVYAPYAQASEVRIYADLPMTLPDGPADSGAVIALYPSTLDSRFIDQDTGEAYYPSPKTFKKGIEVQHIHATEISSLELSALSPMGSRVQSQSDDVFAFNVLAGDMGDVHLGKMVFDLASDGDFNPTASQTTAYLLDENNGIVGSGPVLIENPSKGKALIKSQGVLAAGHTARYTLVLNTVELINNTRGEDDPFTVSIYRGEAQDGLVKKGGFIWSDGHVPILWTGYHNTPYLLGHTLIY